MLALKLMLIAGSNALPINVPDGQEYRVLDLDTSCTEAGHDMYDNPQHTKLKCCPGSEEKVEPCRGVDNCYFCREEPRTVYEVFNKGGKATIRSVDDPSVVKPLPTAGPLTIRGYRCSDAASIGEPWEMNLENVDFAGIDWLRDGQCWDFASYNPPAANNMVQMYELTIKDMAKFATSKYCEINKGKVTDPDPNCTSGHTFGGAEYHTFNAEGFWALKGTKEMILHSREVYRLGCAMDEIGCPNGSCQANDEALVNMVKSAYLQMCDMVCPNPEGCCKSREGFFYSQQDPCSDEKLCTTSGICEGQWWPHRYVNIPPSSSSSSSE